MLKVGWAREGDEEKGGNGGGEGEEGRKGEGEEKVDGEESMKKEEGRSGREREITAENLSHYLIILMLQTCTYVSL